MGLFLDFRPQYLNVIINTISVLQSDCLKNVRGGDIITPKQWFLPIMVVSVATVGLFSGVLNDQNANYSTGSKVVQSPSQSNTAQVASEPKAKAKARNDVLVVTARCSCSCYQDYKLHDPSWINYCPVCHRYGTLIFEKTSDCPEGMMRCTCCDADFCAVHGKEHVCRHPTYLVPA